MEDPGGSADKDCSSQEIELKLRECLNKLEIGCIDPKQAIDSSDILRAMHDLLLNRPPSYRDKLMEMEHKLDMSSGCEKRASYYNALVFILYLRNYTRIEKRDLPSMVVHYLKRDFNIMLKFAMEDNKKFHTFHNYHFLSYLEKLSFSRIPCGCQDIVVSGFSRRLIFQKSFAETVDLAKLLVKMGGNRPLFELHYNPHRLRLFNGIGWQEVFQLAAQIMLKSSEIRGIFGAAWFYDPAIKEISPELYYVRELIESIGGRFFNTGESEMAKQDAFAFSRPRRIAYEEGRYMPTSYMMIIPRLALLKYHGM